MLEKILNHKAWHKQKRCFFYCFWQRKLSSHVPINYQVAYIEEKTVVAEADSDKDIFYVASIDKNYNFVYTLTRENCFVDVCAYYPKKPSCSD